MAGNAARGGTLCDTDTHLPAVRLSFGRAGKARCGDHAIRLEPDTRESLRAGSGRDGVGAHFCRERRPAYRQDVHAHGRAVGLSDVEGETVSVERDPGQADKVPKTDREDKTGGTQEMLFRGPAAAESPRIARSEGPGVRPIIRPKAFDKVPA